MQRYRLFEKPARRHSGYAYDQGRGDGSDEKSKFPLNKGISKR